MDDGREPAPEQQRGQTPLRRRFVGIAFVLAGFTFASSSYDSLDQGALWWLGVLVGVAVAVYGALQLRPPRD